MVILQGLVDGSNNAKNKSTAFKINCMSHNGGWSYDEYKSKQNISDDSTGSLPISCGSTILDIIDRIANSGIPFIISITGPEIKIIITYYDN